LNVGVAVVIGVILFIAIVPILVGFTSAFLARLVQWLR
jgi:FlaG/FlaF family flagellin (archaellin)